MLLSAAAIGGAAVKSLGKVIDDLYGAAKGEVKEVIEKWNRVGERDQIVQKISDVERVKTISSQGLIPLSDFYYPQKVTIAQTKGNQKKSAFQGSMI